MKNILFVGLGGAIGSIARFLISKWIYDLHPQTFPLGTFLVNIFGCFLIGLFYAISAKGNYFSPDFRLFLTTGLCGGFTTFSAFAYENIVLLKSGNTNTALVYISGSLILCIVGTWLGMMLAK